MAWRWSRIPRKRSKPRRGQPTKKEKTVKREFIYELSGGKCELRLHPKCSRDRILPWAGDVFERWHLVHNGAKRRFGWPIEGPRRMRGGCYFCHMIAVHEQGKKIDDAIL